MAYDFNALNYTDQIDRAPLTAQELNDLRDGGSVEQCQRCGRYSAYAWQDVDGVQTASVGTASGDEWECGWPACRAHHVRADSPLNAPCYTHADD